MDEPPPYYFVPIRSIEPIFELEYMKHEAAVLYASPCSVLAKGKWFQRINERGIPIPPFFADNDEQHVWMSVRIDIPPPTFSGICDQDSIQVELGMYLLKSTGTFRRLQRKKKIDDPTLVDLAARNKTVQVVDFFPSPNMRSGWVRIKL